MYRVGIITSSDKGAVGEREDLSGPAIEKILPDDLYRIVSYRILPDEIEVLKEEMIRLSGEERCDLILTTGGTGFSQRDVTPEATLAVCDRMAPGIAEGMGITKRAMLSRAVCGMRGKTLILNLPGSPKAVKEALEYVLDTLPHGIDILTGKAGECAR